ncbi:MAG: arginase family protein [Actinomycetota bacterium]|nr:arginase family protein [Actinomycetota bacterium]
MSSTTLPSDPRWPRAGHLFSAGGESAADLTLIGVPAWRTSISPTGAHATPAAVRAALLRYSTYSAEHGVDLATMRLVDAGDIEEPDGPAGEKRVMTRLAHAQANLGFLVALGGDNSITYSVALGVWGEKIAQAGLITLDAHHDLRDGDSNGSPVRRLIEAGLAGARVVQIGIADYSNSPEYAARARDFGITVITRASLRTTSMAGVMASALAIAGAGDGPIHVDLDVDVCDRSVVPACPAAAPGGISADELRQAAFLAAADPRVSSLDITEVDATIDAPDARTVRLAALLVLEAAAGVCVRKS